MADDAVKMWREMYELIRGCVPDTSLWKREVPNDANLSGSFNKPLVCNTAEGYWDLLTGRIAAAESRLDWWVEFAKRPLGGAEGLSPEEVYRCMPITAAFAGAALARRLKHPVAEEACSKLARAHVAFLALGACTGLGRRVKNHYLNDTRTPHVLIGDGDPISTLPFTAVAGPRGWVRNRKKGEQPLFQFTTGVSFSWLLAKIRGKNPIRSIEPFGHDLCAAILAFEPGTAFYGFSAEDRANLNIYLGDPVNPANARLLLPWIQGTGLAPSQGYTYVRYVDGSVAVFMHKSHTSSTDPTMICVWYAETGKTAMASADDGLRESSDPQVAFETSTAICCQKTSGGIVLSVPKPDAEESYRVDISDRGVATMTTGGQVVQPPKPSAPVAQSPAEEKPTARHGRFWPKFS